MPVAVETRASPPVLANLRERRSWRGSFGDRGRRLRLGLVNNMPDAAVEATRRQFSRLIDDVAPGFDIRLSLWTLETLDRSDEARREMAVAYRPARALRYSDLDALIVTGTEPRAPDLRDEPYWAELIGVVDWAETRTFSTMFSCLAAHAAVDHRDGVRRRPLAAKCSGVFANEVVGTHELMTGLGPAPLTPHSRWNGLDEGELSAKGYQVLTRSPAAGVDLFVKEARALLVFLHGHPEYEADTLARDFRRDAQRFLRGERPTPPALPAHYYAPESEARLRAFLASGSPAEPFPAEALALSEAPWRESSRALFKNWLSLIARRKAALNRGGATAVRWGG